ncbi:MAG: HAMP domain-containing sensor histidine kinase, partial [Clostridium sp.]|nr:HAMP domain-containing sensor histidine kinase [Clostridium sp.]
MAHDEIKKNCISGCAAEKKAETCGGKQNSKRKKTDVIDIAQQLKNEKKIRTYFTLVVFIILTCTLIIAMSLTFVLYRLGIWTAQRVGIFTVLAGISVLSLLLGTAITVILSGNIVRPVNALSTAMQRVANGDYDVKLETKSNFEIIRRVYSDFNHMVDELNAVETLRNDFVSNVSHEFKTPLSSIEGYAMLLQDESLSAEARSEYTERIVVSTRRLSTLVSNILMITKIENQTMPFTLSSYRVDEQVRQSILLLENKWSEKNIGFEMDMDSIEFCAVEGLLGNVWSNLIDNAIKFSPEGEIIYISLKEKDDMLSFKIANRGEPMSGETLKRIFEKFYQG